MAPPVGAVRLFVCLIAWLVYASGLLILVLAFVLGLSACGRAGQGGPSGGKVADMKLDAGLGVAVTDGAAEPVGRDAPGAPPPGDSDPSGLAGTSGAGELVGRDFLSAPPPGVSDPSGLAGTGGAGEPVGRDAPGAPPPGDSENHKYDAAPDAIINKPAGGDGITLDSNASYQFTPDELYAMSIAKRGWGVKLNGNQQPEVFASDRKLFEKYNTAYAGNADDPVIYLTFDLGYENGYTLPILDTLKDRGVKAAFFITGYYL